mmetsp:Transcript_15148/g.25117  ORF Transcript_15148/g.25117 Transcript_15148/m.25117 type:complete len:80 (+) Transcript_15148:251-490(+)
MQSCAAATRNPAWKTSKYLDWYREPSLDAAENNPHIETPTEEQYSETVYFENHISTHTDDIPSFQWRAWPVSNVLLSQQ